MGVRSPRPTPGPTAQGSSARKISPQTFGSRDWVSAGACWSLKQFLLGNPHADSPTQTLFFWALALGWQLEGHQWYYRERLMCLASGWTEPIVLCWALPPTDLVGWCHIWDSINLADTVSPTLEIHQISTLPNLPAHPSCFSKWMAGLSS